MIIDAHGHMGPAFETRPPLLKGVVADDIIRILDGAGIDMVCLFAPAWEGPEFIDPEYKQANRAIYEAMKRYPDRIIGVARIDPNFRGKAIDEMRRCREEYGFRGLKLHPLWEHFLPNNFRLMAPVVELCEEYGWPIFCHSGYYPTCEPALFIPLAERYPNVNIILFHLAYAHTSDAIIAANRCSNLFLETSANSTASAIREVLRNVPPTQFIYGSDLPFTQPEDVIGKIVNQPGIDDGTRRLVLGGNIAHLLDMELT
jgi:uncharacterized protein